MYDNRSKNIYIRSDAMQWQIPVSIKVTTRLFMLVLTVLEILRLEMFDFENLGQSHRVQHSQWSHSMTNINVYKSHT